jgi:hypothetical protein
MSPPSAPLELDPGPTWEVLFVYAVVFVVTIAASKLISTLVVTMLDRRSAEALADKAKNSGRNPERAPSYAIGSLPRAREIFAIGYLKNRTEGVASVLLAEAFASGWLFFSEGRGHVGHLPREASDAARALQRALEYGNVTPERARAAAKTVAASLEPAIVADLESRGLLRPWGMRKFGEIVAVVLALPSGIFGVRRLLEGAHAVGSPELLLLALEIAYFAVVAVALARVSDESERATAYLSWLDDATISLREDVASGRDRRIVDVMLAAALGTGSREGAHESGIANGAPARP